MAQVLVKGFVIEAGQTPAQAAMKKASLKAGLCNDPDFGGF
jgi:hypothetical protein